MRVIILFCLSFQTFGAELKSLDIEIEKAIRTNRSRNIPDSLGEKTQNYINLNFEVDLYKKLYWQNKISTEVTTNQFRYVALDLNLGLHLSRSTDLYYRHYSGHILDYSGDRNFREENSIGIRIKLK